MTLSFTPLYHSMLGFDRLFDEVARAHDAVAHQKATITFPPHNVLKLPDDRFVIELAVAGFSEEEIEITVSDGTLTISGQKQDKIDTAQYLYKGIGARKFTKTFKLSDTIRVQGAEFKHGILRIGLENITPEQQKPKTIPISNSLTGFQPLLADKAA